MAQNRLSGNEAFQLWQKGYTAWNSWLESVDNPIVDFSGQTFEPNTQESNGEKLISFNRYKFPKNTTTFRNVKFKSGHLVFCSIDSPESALTFEDCNMECHRISINDSNLSMITFSNVTSATCRFHIVNSKFNYLNIVNCKFSNGFFQISRLHKDSASITLNSNKFENCNISLMDSKLNSGEIRFLNQNIKGGSVFIENNECSNGNLDFSMNEFNCPFKINNIKNLKTLSLQGTTFNGYAKLSQISISTVLDLIGTKFSNSVVLFDVKSKLNRRRSRERFFLNICEDAEDNLRYRRLKEIAENNKDSELSLKYFSEEKKCQRWTTQNTFNSIIDVLYSAFSKHGSSVMRPLLIWLFSMPLFSIIYFYAFEALSASIDISDAMAISLKNSFPFLSLNKSIGSSTIQSLLSSELILITLSIAQGLISIIFTFLLVLGLRNNFKI